jgi:hypothetical protein
LSQSPEKKTILPVQPTICANGKCIAIGSIYISFYKSCGANVALPPGAAETMGALASASAGTAASLNFPAALGAKFGIDVNEFVNDVIGGASGFLTDVGGFLTGSQRISSPARVPPYPCTITTREPSGTFMGWKKSGYTFFDNNESGSMYALCRIGADPTLLKQFNAWCVCDISKNERFNNFATCEIPPCKSLFKSKKISLPRMK